MGKISFHGDRGGGRRDSRDSDRRRGYQSGHFDRRNGHSGDSRGRSNTSNNNRGSEDLRSRLGKKSSAVEKDKESSVRKREKPVKTTPVKLNHIEEEEKKEEDLELRQMKVRKLNPNAFALSSIVRKQASDNTKVKQLSTKSKGSKVSDEDPDVKIVNSNVKDDGKKFGKTVKSHDGAIRIANDDREIEKRPVERKIKYRPDSPARKVERKRSPSSSSSAETSSDSSHSDHKKSHRKKKKYKRKVEERKRKKTSGKVSAKSLMKQLDIADIGLVLKELSSDQIKLIKNDPSFTKGDLQALGLASPKKSPSESSSSSSSSSSSDSSDSEDEKAEDTSSIQSCEPVSNRDFKRADASRVTRGDELSIEEELALNKARQKALGSPKSPKKSTGKPESKIVKEQEFYVNSKETTRRSHDVPTSRGDERSVSVQDKKEYGDRSRLLNDEEAKKQRLFNRLQKSKSTSDIKSRLGHKIDSPNNLSLSLDKDPRLKSGEKRSSPADDHSSDRSKRRRSDHVGSRDRSSERKRESYDRRTRSPYDRRTRSPYGRRTRSPYDKRSRSPYLWESSYDRRERSPRRHQRSRSRDDKRGISPSSKITSGKIQFDHSS